MYMLVSWMWVAEIVVSLENVLANVNKTEEQVQESTTMLNDLDQWSFRSKTKAASLLGQKHFNIYQLYNQLLRWSEILHNTITN